ncbi:transposon Ty3-I Gag-Pol polyprotein [Nephila pilipes]|uniref:Transposon Ty3-I Gag-Pol polyprotein n=1 Tax=Nephila pilipes TaxID=299642 RepID=A0A8X6P662_NEPPI|nr:transposon Ty3-I Gag-Pol polyprotein [Nephila pilipes]
MDQRKGVPLPMRFCTDGLQGLGVRKLSFLIAAQTFRITVYISIKVFNANKTRITSYHPQSDESIERFHRHLKNALMAHLPDSWLDPLPLVLLRIQTSYKDDMVESSAELVLWNCVETSRIILFQFTSNASVLEFMQSLRLYIRPLKPVLAYRHSSCPVFISKDLFHSPCVFLRLNWVRRPLEQPYVGPYKLVKRTPKIIHFGNRWRATYCFHPPFEASSLVSRRSQQGDLFCSFF